MYRFQGTEETATTDLSDLQLYEQRGIHFYSGVSLHYRDLRTTSLKGLQIGCAADSCFSLYYWLYSWNNKYWKRTKVHHQHNRKRSQEDSLASWHVMLHATTQGMRVPQSLLLFPKCSIWSSHGYIMHVLHLKPQDRNIHFPLHLQSGIVPRYRPVIRCRERTHAQSLGNGIKALIISGRNFQQQEVSYCADALNTNYTG